MQDQKKTKGLFQLVDPVRCPKLYERLIWERKAVRSYKRLKLLVKQFLGFMLLIKSFFCVKMKINFSLAHVDHFVCNYSN